MFFYQKIIDRSALREGFTIPVEYHDVLHALPGGRIARGETRAIKIVVDGVAYDALLKNQMFDEQKFEGHPDVVQVRYGVNSPLAKRLREVFFASWNYVEQMKAMPENAKRKLTIRVPEERQEQLALYASELPNVFVAECVTCAEKVEAKAEIREVTEFEFEQGEFVERKDPKAGIGLGKQLQRIRHLDRSIGDSLKRLYGYRCQMTGELVGEAYGVNVVEAHHIEPFTVSMNNDTSNIIILSPSYHRIVHKAGPVFRRSDLAFVFPNGLVERVKINRHLG